MNLNGLYLNLMAWSPGDGHDADGVVNEASVGLIAPKLESTMGRPSEQRHSRVSKSSLGVVLVFSNIAWAGVCLMLWRQLYEPSSFTLKSDSEFEADFGTCISQQLIEIGGRWC